MHFALAVFQVMYAPWAGEYGDIRLLTPVYNHAFGFWNAIWALDGDCFGC